MPGAEAAIVIDGRDGDVMFAKNAGERQSIASTTKLMTALLTLERARPREVFTAADYDAAPVESQIGLRPGERMTVSDLFEALLLESANDAAETLAEGISGSRDAFVADMNERAAELGLEDTSYANPIGLDDPPNYSTASDLAALTRELLRRPRLRARGRHARGAARVRRAPAHGRQPQHAGRHLPVRERRQDRAHARRRLRADRLGARPQRAPA